ncbi:MAG TPA: hypothetical protein V6C91_12570 [Coleofasciculaceae cyanobacterium]
MAISQTLIVGIATALHRLGFLIAQTLGVVECSVTDYLQGEKLEIQVSD